MWHRMVDFPQGSYMDSDSDKCYWQYALQAIVTNLLNVQHISIQMVYSLKSYHTNCFCPPSKDEDQSSEHLPTEREMHLKC